LFVHGRILLSSPPSTVKVVRALARKVYSVGSPNRDGLVAVPPWYTSCRTLVASPSVRRPPP
jgi:hypothetical protein